MRWSEILGSVAEKLSKVLPDTPHLIRQDLEKNFRAVLEAAFGQLDLVTREEFAIQSQLLARCRERIDALEKIVHTLESGN